ncbi:heme-binding protein [Sansalvadorimonas sp. 2012CJ34-2]|uniref:Heme-binding protein n=1 Tax=Parendozoicomonas callyspongiae TaxID=2942213 RepID=A0ABT0PDH0_9GAMM|nr:heme-binding protein [Sansalvadorimonas sp. 2012CJ34-2]MCL6269434.1 heme-binding protein [Sansalvadorimonas sp. 2012CJ34-2]
MNKIIKIVASCLFAASVASSVSAEETRPYLPSATALKGVQACQTLATKNNWNMAIVIVDRGENVLASLRMDDALPGAYTGATLKATTALSWSTSTGNVLEFTKKNPQFNQFPGLLPIGGGEPIFSESGKLIGAVGVAGGYVEHDEECAKAVVAKISEK